MSVYGVYSADGPHTTLQTALADVVLELEVMMSNYLLANKNSDVPAK